MAQSPVFDIAGKVAVITGASYGLGTVFAETLAAAGARVVLTARSAERLEHLAERLRKSGGEALAVACDVGESAQVKAMVEAACARFGRVDVLVNNAGIAADALIAPERIPDSAFEQTIRINLLGAWYCCRETGVRMLADGRGGSIINIASMLGVGGQQGMPPAYQASKAALINLTRNLACNWANRGVRVNAIAPGWFPSELTSGLLSVPAFRSWVEGQAPMSRVGNPAELAGPLLFLASDASSFVTGQTLCVDGGVSAAIGCLAYPAELFEMHAEGLPDNLGKRIGY